MAETSPTPKPAKNRPATKRDCPVEAVCRTTPRLKTTPAANIKPRRRPIQSAIGAARSAPKKVPADKMDTIRDSSALVTPSSPGLENVCFQYFMPIIPLMVPVSYLCANE